MVCNGKFMVYFMENPIKMNDLGVPSHLWKPAYMVEQRKKKHAIDLTPTFRTSQFNLRHLVMMTSELRPWTQKNDVFFSHDFKGIFAGKPSVWGKHGVDFPFNQSSDFCMSFYLSKISKYFSGTLQQSNMPVNPHYKAACSH